MSTCSVKVSTETALKLRKFIADEMFQIDAEIDALKERKRISLEEFTELTQHLNSLGHTFPDIVIEEQLSQQELTVTQEQDEESDQQDPPILPINGQGPTAATSGSKPKPERYSEDWSLRKKVSFILNKAGKELSTVEIKEKLIKQEPLIDTANVIAILGQGVKAKVFTRNNPEEGGKPLFGLPG